MGKNFRSPSQATTSSFHSFSDLTKGEKFRQKTKKNCRSIGKFLYNKESHTFCNKTCKNWCFLILFYSIFLAILLGVFFGVVLLIMYYIRSSRNEPYFDKTTLMPGSSPAIGIAPRIADRVTSIIWYTHRGTIHKHKDAKPEMYIAAVDKLLQVYDNLDRNMYIDCDVEKPKKGQYCIFTREKLGPCGKRGYGYDHDQPCIYLKLNKVKGWIPERRDGFISRGEIPLICEGITEFDKDHMGKISFYPNASFKDYFFPYDGSRNYRSPLVSIQFENVDRGFVIGVKCSFKAEITNMQNSLLHTATVFLYIDNK